ncbi:hypothetical protein AUP68_15680 [Ilyonectria robusta]
MQQTVDTGPEYIEVPLRSSQRFHILLRATFVDGVREPPRQRFSESRSFPEIGFVEGCEDQSPRFVLFGIVLLEIWLEVHGCRIEVLGPGLVYLELMETLGLNGKIADDLGHVE